MKNKGKSSFFMKMQPFFGSRVSPYLILFVDFYGGNIKLIISYN